MSFLWNRWKLEIGSWGSSTQETTGEILNFSSSVKFWVKFFPICAFNNPSSHQTTGVHELRAGHEGDAAEHQHARRQEEGRLLRSLHQWEVGGAQCCCCGDYLQHKHESIHNKPKLMIQSLESCVLAAFVLSWVGCQFGHQMMSLDKSFHTYRWGFTRLWSWLMISSIWSPAARLASRYPSILC